MPDINGVKIENHFHPGSLNIISAIKNFFKKDYFKETTNILFIDDSDMPVVENLKGAGYRVKKIRDIKDVDNSEVKNAQIIFVDYKGVGKNISETYEGLGLIERLIATYLKKKRVILYSAHNFPNDIVMNEIFNKAHNRIAKNADTSEFIKMIESEIKKL